MKSYGIVLRDWEASSIIEGRKTQMRFIARDKTLYVVGDRLLGRETWQPTGVSENMGTQIHYKVEGCEWKQGGKVSLFPQRWRSPATMPLWACRIRLEVTQVRVQRVQEITEEDAIAEGSQTPLDQLPKKLRSAVLTERCMFARLWNYAHGPDAWTRNDQVQVVTFRKI